MNQELQGTAHPLYYVVSFYCSKYCTPSLSDASPPLGPGYPSTKKNYNRLKYSGGFFRRVRSAGAPGPRAGGGAGGGRIRPPGRPGPGQEATARQAGQLLIIPVVYSKYVTLSSLKMKHCAPVWISYQSRSIPPFRNLKREN